MGGEWKHVKFSELCDIWRGGSPRPIHDFIRESGIPWVKIADATSSRTRFIEKTKEFIKSEGMSKSREVFPGDLILSNSATSGLPMFMSIRACIHDGWLLLRNFKNIDKLFCYYLLVHERENIVRFGSGSVFTNLKTDILKNHEVNIPPLPEQRAIAHILGSLDDKIELNRRMNETLEAMARAIFKRWFIDFEFPNENGEPYKSSGGEMIDSPLGPIPKGWKISTIDQILNCFGGGTPDTRNPLFWENGTLHWVTPKDLSKVDSPFLLNSERRITEEGLKKISSGLLPERTILMSSRAPIGYTAITSVPAAVNQGFIAMICNIGISHLFVYHWVKANIDLIRSKANGTSFLEISKKNFKPIELIVPNEERMRDFDKLISPLFRCIEENCKQKQALVELRDALLPKLMSGEIRVPVSEKEVDQF